MFAIPEQRDTGHRFFRTVAEPAAAAVIDSWAFHCGDSCDVQDMPTSGTEVLQDVRGPGMNALLVLPTASAGATLSLIGAPNGSFTDSFAIWTIATAAAGTYHWGTILNTVLVGLHGGGFSAPCAWWKMRFTNGVAIQAAGFFFSVRGGGAP